MRLRQGEQSLFRQQIKHCSVDRVLMQYPAKSQNIEITLNYMQLVSTFKTSNYDRCL